MDNYNSENRQASGQGSGNRNNGGTGRGVAMGILIVIIVILLGYAVYWYANDYHGMALYPSANTGTPTSNYSGTAPAPITSTSPLAPQPSSPLVTTGSTVGTSNSTALVTGTVNPQGPITTYWYNYGTDQSVSQATIPETIGSGFGTFTAPGYITGLSANTTYYYRLGASNNVGTVSGSVNSFTTNSNPPQPSAPSSSVTQSATNIGRTSATVNGQVNPNNSPTSYWFEYGPSTDFGMITSIQSLASANGSAPVSADLANLAPLTKYYFRLNSENQYGTVNGSTFSFTTTGPAAPTAPTVVTNSASSLASSSAVLNGRINPNGAATTYWFEYSQDSAIANLIGTVPVNPAPNEPFNGTSNITISTPLTDLSGNTLYYYRLVGQNQYGTVDGSIVSFTTKK